MTRETLNHANKIVAEIDRLNDATKAFTESNEVILIPDIEQAAGDLCSFTKSKYKFGGELKIKLAQVLVDECRRLEKELAEM